MAQALTRGSRLRADEHGSHIIIEFDNSHFESAADEAGAYNGGRAFPGYPRLAVSYGEHSGSSSFLPETDFAADPYAVSDEELPEDAEELAAMTRSLLGLVQIQRTMLEQRAPQPEDRFAGLPPAGSSTAEPSSTFLLALDDEQYDAELARLVEWVDGFLLPTYGREVSANRPWCQRWFEHPEAAARLHSLWLAYGQHVDEEAGPSGMAVWHRDILDHTLTQLRAPDGPFAACGTRAGSDTHRLLEPPGPTLYVSKAA